MLRRPIMLLAAPLEAMMMMIMRVRMRMVILAVDVGVSFL
jgi:hypothetical protein